ncbi:MAG: hypothetical protein H6R15_3684 [Proteobacteria bacterium]|nr:hypothetical protein [Pseudomonadota bacterium]
MSTPPETHSPPTIDANVKSILEWLALTNSRQEPADPDQLYRQLLLLRETPIAPAQQVRLLDLLYQQAERIVDNERSSLCETSLPVSRRLRQRVRLLLKLLETLTQDYFNTLSELFDPQSKGVTRPPQTTLRQVMHCVAWQIRINHLIASPSGIGLWQQMHAAFGTSRRLGIADTLGRRGEASIQQIYTATLLAAIAQPASFSAEELELIWQYIEHTGISPELTEEPPADSKSIFWIDLDKDFPAHALPRRIPSADTQVLYFSCDAIAHKLRADLALLNQGIAATAIGLPEQANSRAGKSVLRRLETLWGHPAKRKFPRRRQSYRTRICAGFNNLWRLLKNPETDAELSEWMVINESPDGYSLMHVNGHTHRLRVGDIAALQPIGERAEFPPVWQICIVRWALSENPEHIELGLQLLAPHAIAAELAMPGGSEIKRIPALILPEAAPLRPSQSLIVPTGSLKNDKHKLIVLMEKENLEIREMRATQLDEQTSRIEIFSVAPDEKE